MDKLHNGYFAQDKKGVLKDTRGDTQADDEVYNLIMKEKERLLSIDEPLRFIFSHSALREGWDNPNVFQICTLNETSADQEEAGDRPRFAPARGPERPARLRRVGEQALRHGQRELRGLCPGVADRVRGRLRRDLRQSAAHRLAKADPGGGWQ